jgi:hypothetical protein
VAKLVRPDRMLGKRLGVDVDHHLIALALKKITSPSVANAIETFKVRPREEGNVSSEIRALKFQFAAAHVSASHANVHLVDFGTPVKVGGVWIKPGDLVHFDFDQHGVVTIPHDSGAEPRATAPPCKGALTVRLPRIVCAPTVIRATGAESPGIARCFRRSLVSSRTHWDDGMRLAPLTSDSRKFGSLTKNQRLETRS